ncbi:hypothetical protein SAMN02787142_0703 [Burkholderia sp. WP9]|uniref:hypothetical protein n=1 Tax=Burkholderia sp. WP9 TaxID=1500263 RepID=UPI00089433F8|nr:hypothetical protein [Burkholderia sp. WP9]SEC00324.1 hypothetical protein SAMN02787142_0703 [Burkholderia sp. WP9]
MMRATPSGLLPLLHRKKALSCIGKPLKSSATNAKMGQRHRISKKRLRRFECSFKGPDGFVDSDIFETREVVHAKMVACRLARERGAKPLLDTFRAASA